MRRKSFGRNDGQTLVEFALVLPIFLLVVVGVLQFGRAITYWLDLNDSAHLAVRYAATNRFPGCDASSSAACTPGSLTGFETFAKNNLNSNGLKNSTTVFICYENADTNTALSIGDSVRLRMESPFNLVGLFNFNLNLRGRGTMRMEQTISSTNPTKIGPIPTC